MINEFSAVVNFGRRTDLTFEHAARGSNAALAVAGW
jgi:hypothetical protein